MSRASIVSRIAHESVRHSPSTMPQGPWWDHLESNFYARPEWFDLEPRDAVRVNLTAAGDVVLRTAAATAIAATALPMGFNPLRLRQAMGQRGLYEAAASSGDPETFFFAPPPDVRVNKRPVRGYHFKPIGGTCEALSFESPFEPVNARLRKSYLGHRRNRLAHARHWTHHDGPRPTIVAIHGFAADPYWLNEWFFALPWFYKMGCDVLLFTLPFHGFRQMRFSPFSGYGFFAGGLSWINECFAQAVCDFRVFLRYLEDTLGTGKVGVTGVSLGGMTSALLAAVEERLYFAIPNVPVVSIADLVLEWEPVGSLARAGMRLLGKNIKEIRHMLAASCPITYPPKLPKERLMIIGGVGDRLAPPKHSRLLWDHWGRPRIHWFPGSHVLHLDKGAYFKQMAVFLSDIGFLDGVPRA